MMSNNDNSGWNNNQNWQDNPDWQQQDADAQGWQGAGDEYSETSHRSWLQRLGDSIKGVLVGLILVFGSGYLLFWNEGRAVQTANALYEGAGLVVSVDNTKVDPANAGKLIHIAGPTSAQSAITEPDFGFEARGLRLVRKVEMYQWKEERRTETRQKLGGGEETITRYIYSREWSDRAINSSSFRQPGGRQNPSFPPYQSRGFGAGDARLGAFSIDDRILSRLGQGETFDVPQSAIQRARQRLGDRARIERGGIYAGFDPDNPQVGDVRITYSLVPLQDISAIGQQTNSSLSPYVTSNKRTVLLAERGNQNAAAMFQHAQDENRMITWILRVVGIVLMFAGFALILAPISTLASVIPILGDIAGFGTSLIAMLATAVVAPLIIAIAWLFHRPLVSAAAIAAAVVIIMLIRHWGRQRAAQKAAQAQVAPSFAGAAPQQGGGFMPPQPQGGQQPMQPPQRRNTFLPPGFGKKK